MSVCDAAWSCWKKCMCFTPATLLRYLTSSQHPQEAAPAISGDDNGMVSGWKWHCLLAVRAEAVLSLHMLWGNLG